MFYIFVHKKKEIAMRKVNLYTENTVDINGEHIQKKWITKESLSEKLFVKTFIDDISKLARCSDSEKSVMLCCLRYAEPKTNVVHIGPKVRLDIAECGGLKLNTVNIAISKLVQKEMLIKEDAGKYILNPEIFFSGDEIARADVLELTLSYRISRDSKIKKI